MGFRMRKSIKLGPGVRMNFSKSGVGVSAGPRGMRYSINTSGRTYKSVGIPGTGLSYVKTGKVGSRTGSSQRSPAQEAPVGIPRPGMLAPKYEKAFAKAVEHFVNGRQQEAFALFKDATQRDVKEEMLADDFFAGLISIQLGDLAGAIPYLEKVAENPVGLPDALMQKYIPGGHIALPITALVTVEAGFDSLTAALALAECYQEVGRIEEAIGVLQQLVEFDPDPAIVLSLCELYTETKAWGDVIGLAAGTRNTDDATLQILLFHARALVETGMREPAVEAYKEALKSQKRNPELLKEARYSRGAVYAELGQKAKAKADFAKVYSDDPRYGRAAEWLQSLQ